MQVWVYPERKFEELGATRYQLSWEELTAEAEKNIGTAVDFDPDTDIVHRYMAFKTKAAAVKKGLSIVNSGKTAFGACSVVKQTVDWFVKEDRIAEWTDVGDSEEIA